ncbi:SUKH-4 family immunity protein [Embleya sp. NPDC005575]|uniref:SUKH-4 family immunity protein n=1 Tax=Embleya sp. NPDC005575 TaxID=3156892 RepID=UPI0033AD6A9D
MGAVTRDEVVAFLREAESSAEAALLRLYPEPRERPDGMLALGEFAWFAPRVIVLEPATGRVYSELADRTLLAGGLDTFGRLLREVESLRTGTGTGIGTGGRCDPVEASRAALARVRGYEPRVLDSDPDVCAFWRAALLVWPLLHAVEPGRDGLCLEFTHEALAADSGAERVARIPEGNIPEVLRSHAPSLRFLRDVGLIDALPLVLDEDRPLWVATSEEFEDEPYPDAPDVWRPVRLGALPLIEADLVVDGLTGRVYAHYPDEPAERCPVNTDLSTLAFAQWMVARVRVWDREFAITDDYDGLATIMTAVLGTVDPLAVRGPAAYWPNMFDDEPGGLLYA